MDGLKKYEAGVTAIQFPFRPRWTGDFLFAHTGAEADELFQQKGYYRNLVVREVEGGEIRFSVLEYDDPTLYDGAYWQALCNGSCIGTAETKKGAEAIVRDYKKNFVASQLAQKKTTSRQDKSQADEKIGGLLVARVSWIPKGTIVFVPMKRKDETKKQWLDRCGQIRVSDDSI